MSVYELQGCGNGVGTHFLCRCPSAMLLACTTSHTIYLITDSFPCCINHMVSMHLPRQLDGRAYIQSTSATLLPSIPRQRLADFCHKQIDGEHRGLHGQYHLHCYLATNEQALPSSSRPLGSILQASFRLHLSPPVMWYQTPSGMSLPSMNRSHPSYLPG